MIRYAEVFALLVAACPSFAGSPQAALADESDGEFLRVGHLASHLIALLVNDETECFPAVFGIAEWVLEEGDDDARMVISDGFFQDLIDTDLYDQTAKLPGDFGCWLGPRAREVPAVEPFL